MLSPMISLLGSWVVLTLAFWLTAQILPGFHVKSLGGGLKAAAVFGILQTFFAGILFLVLGTITFGLGFIFAFLTHGIVSAILLKVTDSMSSSLKIDGFGWAFLGGFMISFSAFILAYFDPFTG